MYIGFLLLQIRTGLQYVVQSFNNRFDHAQCTIFKSLHKDEIVWEKLVLVLRMQSSLLSDN